MMMQRLSSGIMGLTIGTIAAPFLYVPDLAPVGSGAAYYPRGVAADANALNFLGFLTDAALSDLAPDLGSQSADMNQEAGAWDPAFRAAVTRFQAATGLTVDSWIGPQTRTRLASAVLQRNASPGALPAIVPPALPVPVTPGGVPAKPAILPGVTPASSNTGGLSTLEIAGIGVGVAALGALAWYALK